MGKPIRITKVGGRYLVFDVTDVATLRRDHCICAVLVGTLPQNPNQNLFSGLPLELFAEEAKLLVEKGAAYIVDDANSHLVHLSSIDPAARQAYLKSLKTRRKNLQRVIDDQVAEKKKVGEELKVKAKAKAKSKRAIALCDQDTGIPSNEPEAAADVHLLSPNNDSLFSASPLPNKPESPSATPAGHQLTHITPNTSIDMLADPEAYTVPIETPRAYPLYRHLNSKGFYITPGIRFGADYSVYPGDPFRYHAHFMATSFEWDEEITVLDLVSGGRLGTGVKKGFMIGGEAPWQEGESNHAKDRVRAFTIEWAAM